MIRRTIIGVVTGVVLFGASATGAQASQTVVQAIESQSRIIAASPAFKSIENLGEVNTPAKAQKVIPKLKAFDTELSHGAGVVSAATATSSQKTAQRDWVRGIKDEAVGIREVTIALQDLLKNESSAARAEVAKGVKTAKAGETLALKAKALLNIPATA